MPSVQSDITVVILLQAKREDTLDLCRLLNDDLAATVAKYPSRFVGLGTLPMQAPELAVKELERCVKVSYIRLHVIHAHILNVHTCDVKLYAFTRTHTTSCR